MTFWRTIVLLALLGIPALAQGETVPLSYQEAVGRFLTMWYQRTAPSSRPLEKPQVGNSNGLTLSLTPQQAAPEFQGAVGREGQLASYAFRQVYLEALRCEEGVRVLETLRKQAEDCQKVAEEMNRGGQVPTFDIHQLKTLVLRMEEGLSRARATRESSQARLVYLLAQPRGSRYSLTEHLLPKPDPVLVLEEKDTRDLEALGKRALTQRPELQELARFVPQSAAQGPQFGLSVNNLSPVNYRHDGNVVGMLSASLPLGQGSDASAPPRRDTAQQRGLEEQVLLEVEQAWWAVQEADKAFELSALAADHAAEAVRLGRIRYGVGATPAGELVNALTAQSEAQLNLLAAAHDQPLARLKLALAVGVLP